MKIDLFGSPVALASDTSLGHWNATCLGFLAHSASTPEHLGKLLTEAPDFALGHALKGMFCVLLGRREMFETARQEAATARAMAETAGSYARQDGILAALDAMLRRDPKGAIAALERILMADPRDSLAMKLSHAIRFVIGDAIGMRRSVERVLAAHGGDHPGRGYALGCHAFALEETGSFDAAERTGLQGLDYAHDDAWGLHAVAHVHDMTAQADAGIALIDGNRTAWLGSNNFRYHVWWHKALLHLDRGETDVVLALYDQKIREDKTDDYRDIANGTSMLARLELEGVDVGDRWDELAAYSDARVEDGCLVFADLHYMLALMGGNRAEAQAKLAANVARLARSDDGLAPCNANPGAVAIEGLAAFGEGRYGHAFNQLEAARPQLWTMGGSHAQRDVFERMTIEAGLRAGLLERTETILRDRTARRGGNEDAFAATRMQRLAALRQSAHSVPAQ